MPETTLQTSSTPLTTLTEDEILFRDKSWHSIDDKLDIPLTQFTIERCCLDVKR